MYYRNANCAVVVYDITQKASLEKAKAWVKELQRQANENIVIALAGNKVDLEDQRQVDTAEAEAYAQEAGLLFMETSAKNSQNVHELFTAIAKKLPLETHSQNRPRPMGGRGSIDLSKPASSTTGLNKDNCAC